MVLWLLHLHLLLRLSRVTSLTTIVHLLLARIASRSLRIAVVWCIAHWVRGLVVRLAVVAMLWLVVLLVVVTRHLLPMAASEVDEQPSFIVLRVVLQAQLAAYLLYARLDLLDVVWAVVSFADDDVKVRLAGRLCVSDSLFDDFLCFFHVLAVQIDGVASDFSYSVVLAEDELGSLLVYSVGLGSVSLGLLALQERVRSACQCEWRVALRCTISWARAPSPRSYAFLASAAKC